MGRRRRRTEKVLYIRGLRRSEEEEKEKEKWRRREGGGVSFSQHSTDYRTP